MIARPRTLTLVLVLLALAGALAVGLNALHGTAAHADAPPAAAVAEPQRIDAISADSGTEAADLADVDAQFVAALFGPDTDHSTAHALELTYAGHRVCEGHTAGVPVDVIASTLADEYGWTADEGARFVTLADQFYCGTPAV
jgi:hypothetical protein